MTSLKTSGTHLVPNSPFVQVKIGSRVTGISHFVTHHTSKPRAPKGSQKVSVSNSTQRTTGAQVKVSAGSLMPAPTAVPSTHSTFAQSNQQSITSVTTPISHSKLKMYLDIIGYDKSKTNYLVK